MTAEVDEGFHSAGDVGDLRLVRRLAAEVVRAGEDHDDLGVDAVEFAVGETPEDVLNAVGTPAEVGGVPAEEILFPIGEELRVVGRSVSLSNRAE